MNEEKRYSFDEVVKEAYIEEQVTKKLEEAKADISDPILKNKVREGIEQEYKYKNTEGIEIGNSNNKKYIKSLKSILNGLGVDYKELEKLKTKKGYAFSEKSKNFLVKILVTYHTDKNFKKIFERKSHNEIIFDNIDGLLETAVELNGKVMSLIEGLNNMFLEEREYRSLGITEQELYEKTLKSAVNSFDYHRRKKEYEISKIFLNSIRRIRTKNGSLEEIDLPSDTDCYWLDKFEECMKKDLEILEEDLDNVIEIRTNMRRIYIEDIYEKLSLNPLEEKNEQFKVEMYEILEEMEKDSEIQKMLDNIEEIGEKKINRVGLIMLVQLLGKKSYKDLDYRRKSILRNAMIVHTLILKDKDYKQLEVMAEDLYEWIRMRVKTKVDLFPIAVPQIPKEQLYDDAVKRSHKCSLDVKENNNAIKIAFKLKNEMNKNKRLRSQNRKLKAELKKIKKFQRHK